MELHVHCDILCRDGARTDECPSLCHHFEIAIMWMLSVLLEHDLLIYDIVSL